MGDLLLILELKHNGFDGRHLFPRRFLCHLCYDESKSGNRFAAANSVTKSEFSVNSIFRTFFNTSKIFFHIFSSNQAVTDAGNNTAGTVFAKH